MKTLKKPLCLILVLTSIFLASGLSLAQVPTTESEAERNTLLYQNSLKARENLDKQKANEPVQELRTLGTSNSQKLYNGVDLKNLTDQEKQLSEKYIHQGKANDIITKECAGENRSVCNGEVGNHKFMGMDPNLVKALAQAYSMIGAMAGDSFGGLKKGDSQIANEKKEAEEIAKKNGGEAEKVDTKANDYCKYIPTVTETLATVTQSAKSKELLADGTASAGGATAQKDSLLKAAKSHDSRATMAKIQATGWIGGAACYGVNMATGAFAADRNAYLKLGAASLLGYFYINEVSANKAYADKTRKIADSLPNVGDCNPITDNLCYCSQASTQNDPVYCAKGLSTKKLAATTYRLACTNDQLKIDPQCLCEKNNSCFDSYLEQASGGSLGLGIGHANSPFKEVRSLARGELTGGTANNIGNTGMAAIAKKALKDISSKIPINSSPLTKEQKGLVDAMVRQGLPLQMATLMAQNPPSASATNSAMAKFKGGLGGEYAEDEAPRSGSNIVDFSGGDGLKYNAGNKNDSNNGDNDLLEKLKPGANKNAANSKLIEFANKAEEKAKQGSQIRKDDGTRLFDIISMRYQTSGRRLLEIDANN